ncbi:hypothetical protein [Terrarubrum flagellatum]|uniref:hypothetical protein n=1 Tax=Terrirubrum flagellatum TaxID=2895980 RepID=UPI0031454D34
MADIESKTALARATHTLMTIAKLWPANKPAPDEGAYDDMESAYGNGLDVSLFNCAKLAREALEAIAIAPGLTCELYLKHGRASLDVDMDDWGPDGPRLQNVTGLHQTYDQQPIIIFATQADAANAQALTGWQRWDDDRLMMAREGDCIVGVKDGVKTFYGDWGLWFESPYTNGGR